MLIERSRKSLEESQTRRTVAVGLSVCATVRCAPTRPCTDSWTYCGGPRRTSCRGTRARAPPPPGQESSTCSCGSTTTAALGITRSAQRRRVAVTSRFSNGRGQPDAHGTNRSVCHESRTLSSLEPGLLMNPTPCTLHPAPHTLQHTRYSSSRTLHHAPCTPHLLCVSAPSTRHLHPFTQYPTYFIPHSTLLALRSTP
jgi:hypothetical protein